MIELPGSLREFVIERIEDELTSGGGPEKWIRSVMAGLEALAEEIGESDGENLIPNLEESGELEQSLAKVLEKQYQDLGDEPSGETLLSVLDKICEVAWINEEADDEIARGFLDGNDDLDEEEF